QQQQQQQQSPLGYGMAQGQGSSVSPAGSSTGGTVRGNNNSANAATAAIQTTPRRQSGSNHHQMMMQNPPHTIASSHHAHHHQYVPHHPSNLGLASSSSSLSNNGIMNGQNIVQYSAPGSTVMMQPQMSQQGGNTVLLQPNGQQVAYATTFQSPQATGGQQQDGYGYAVYAQQQPHIMQTPQHSNNHMMQHPHTAPQLQHPSHHHMQQQPGNGSNNNMLTVNSYGTDYANPNGMNVFPFSTDSGTHPGQTQLSPSYPQQQMMQQQPNSVYSNQMSPLNMSTDAFRAQQQQQGPVSTQMGQAMSMQGLPSQQQPLNQQHNMNMMRSQSAISRTPSELSTFNGSQPPPLDPSLLNGGSNNSNLSSSQDSSSVETNFSQQSTQAAKIVAAQMANGNHLHQGQPGTRPGTASGPERETAAELMLYLAASPSPQQPSKKVGNTALGGGDLSQVKGRKLFGGNDDHSMQQQQGGLQQRNNSMSSSTGHAASEMGKSQSQMGMVQDHNNPFSVQHTYPGMNDPNQPANMQQQQEMYSSQGGNSNLSASASGDMQAHAAAQLAQPFEYNQAMQFDPYSMMTAQGVTLDQEFGSGW
ncbi:hypothetical protein P389DRAFT_172470, partial [Cystobasidium minutum MCA 4210]|uniref:uncharacterized protein n=1 Tax=Cystobasidium minutum MCA 4210 TaxID=1397322 RepID=UPI0034CFAE4C